MKLGIIYLEFDMKGVYMTEHYYSRKPNVKSKPVQWTCELRNKPFKFTSDAGVFSKNEVDFGSRLLIEAFDKPKIDGSILDLGCGYGPIGLSIANSFLDHHVVMVDVNERALELARKNAEINKIDNVEVKQSNLFDGIGDSKFAAILSNPPIRAGKKVVHQILEDSYAFLENSGELWIVIQKKQGAPSTIEKLNSIYDTVEVVLKKKGYYIIRSKKFDSNN
jgi:16S rRNA (guanine1207-N2)-methyltransferase